MELDRRTDISNYRVDLLLKTTIGNRYDDHKVIISRRSIIILGSRTETNDMETNCNQTQNVCKNINKLK